MPVIQFDYAYLLSVNEKGEQVRMRTILDTSTCYGTGYGTACVIAVKGGGDKYAISSAVSFLERIGSTHNFDAGRIPCLRSRQWWMRSIKCLSDDCAVEEILPEEAIAESHASLGDLEG